MSEEFLQFVWQYKLYSQLNLKTVSGKTIEVIHPGEFNSHAGPDFFNSKIKIDGILWAGNVEVHQTSSDWYAHFHHSNKAYDNVIFHVVDDNNSEVYRSNGDEIPVLVLQYPDNLVNQYHQLKSNIDWLACAGKLDQISAFEFSLWLQRMLVEKLEEKSKVIKEQLVKTTNNWDEVFYRLLFRGFGFGVNGDPFQLLAQTIPLNILLKYADNLQLIEALLFGQAGFLRSDYKDEYLNKLWCDYNFLKQKHRLVPIENHLWKFLRLRPSNFPTIRISQLANLLVKLKGVFGLLINESELKVVLEQLSVRVSTYWESHYLPEKKSEKISKCLGQSSKNLIIINTVIPLMFAYGKENGKTEMKEFALEWLTKLKPEKNSLLKKWIYNDICVKNAGDSQALIYLSNYYCKQKKCLRCAIGHKVLIIN